MEIKVTGTIQVHLSACRIAHNACTKYIRSHQSVKKESDECEEPHICI